MECIIKKRKKKKIILITLVQAISGILDTLSILSVFPFLSLLTNPNFIETNKYIKSIINNYEFSYNELIILFGSFSFFTVLLTQSVKLFSSWYSNFVSTNLWFSFTKRMYDYYIKKDYLFHLNNNSYFLVEKLAFQVNAAQSGVIAPLFNLIGYIFTILFIIISLLIIQPVVTSFSVMLVFILFFFFF